jgi:hypothetical protein
LFGVDPDALLKSVFDELPNALINELGEERAIELAEKEPERLRKAISEAVVEAAAAHGQMLAEDLKEDGPLMLARRRAEGRVFERMLAQRWARPFDLAEMTMVVAYEAGEAFNKKHSRQARRDNDLVFAVLVRLHARGCRIAEEVLTLLKAGFGQAAMARWRVLHEVAVVAAFIATHDRDTAERYLLHQNIEGWRGMEELHTRVDRLGVADFTEEQRRDAKETADELVARFGKKYALSYGWAHSALVAEDPAYEKERVTFSAIEEAVSLDHLRPYYRMASHAIHANPKGILFTPDLLYREPPILLAGPSPTGLADPGQCAVISLNQLTATLLTYKTGESAGIILTALMRLTDEAANAYVETQAAVEDPRNPPPYGIVTRVRYRVSPRLAVWHGRLSLFLARVRSSVRRGRWSD